MPLVFSSLSHGDVAFGFFNIETDMLLLNNYFFFATDFAGYVAEIAEHGSGRPYNGQWHVYVLEDREIGNLMGAIHAIQFRGFIGEVYKTFPFPEEREAFRQNPDSCKTRGTIEEIISRYRQPTTVQVTVDESGDTIDIGDYLFSREGFHALLRYVCVGGYPRWKNDIPPVYVQKMKEQAQNSPHPLFSGLPF